MPFSRTSNDGSCIIRQRPARHRALWLSRLPTGSAIPRPFSTRRSNLRFRSLLWTVRTIAHTIDVSLRTLPATLRTAVFSRFPRETRVSPRRSTFLRRGVGQPADRDKVVFKTRHFDGDIMCALHVVRLASCGGFLAAVRNEPAENGALSSLVKRETTLSIAATPKTNKHDTVSTVDSGRVDGCACARCGRVACSSIRVY